MYPVTITPADAFKAIKQLAEKEENRDNVQKRILDELRFNSKIQMASLAAILLTLIVTIIVTILTHWHII